MKIMSCPNYHVGYSQMRVVSPAVAKVTFIQVKQFSTAYLIPKHYLAKYN